MAMARLVSTAAMVCLLLWSHSSFAYTFGGPFGEPCHENISWQALRIVRTELDAAAPLTSTAVDELFMADLVFSIPDDMNDVGGVTLAVGVRDNDLKGHSGLDAQHLPQVHGDPDGQREHCLRRPEHDGSEGNEAALADCRAYILERFDQSLGGLDGAGRVDGSQRMPLVVHLAFRGRVELSLPLFYVRLGQALHALQDGFSHTFRTADQRRVTVVLNWVDFLGDFDEARDGPPHLHRLDLCDDADTLRTERHRLARAAALELVRAALDPSRDIDQRKARAAQLLDDYLSFEAGCTFANNWCDAPENEYRSSGCGCRVAGHERPAQAGWLALLLLGALMIRRPTRHGARLAGAIALVAALSSSRRARAGDVWAEGSHTGWAAHSAISGSFDNGALAYNMAGRYGITNRWLVGLDAEYNPWFSLEAARFRRGAFNTYATAIYRYPISKRVALRVTGHLGMSVLLFDLVGAPKGSVGPYLGVNLLGLSYELGEHVYFIIDPADVAVAAPQISGAPFIYHQYRLTIGVQLGA